MSGHNKWSSIKHKKGAQDVKRGKIFTKLIREITVSAKFGGGEQNTNPRLRTAILAAKIENMPKDNIERAIKKGTGELEGTTYEENIYEGYGPGGSAILVESLTDNKNRAVAEIRHIFSKYGGNLGENGCVSWNFNKKGLIRVRLNDVNEDYLMDTIIEAGVEDVQNIGDFFEITTSPENLETVKLAVENASIPYMEALMTMIPHNTSGPITGRKAAKMEKMLNALEDCDDVQRVHTNLIYSHEYTS